MDPTAARAFVLDKLQSAFTTKEDTPLIGPTGKKFSWFIDTKKVLLTPGMPEALGFLFWNALKDHVPFQVGGLETVSIALSTATATAASHDGTPINAFYVRKERKRDGLQRFIEGTLTSDPVIVIDDSINSGRSIKRTIEILRNEGYTIAAVCVLIAFRSEPYDFLTSEGIPLISLFTLADFPKTNGPLQEKPTSPPPKNPFRPLWHMDRKGNDLFHIERKSAPVLLDSLVCIAGDTGNILAASRETGEIIWQYTPRSLFRSRRYFVQPHPTDHALFFVDARGDLVALDDAGTPLWATHLPDTAHPHLALNDRALFVSLESGIVSKRGGVASYRMRDGTPQWIIRTTYRTHAPHYSPRYRMVYVTDETGTLHAYQETDGAHLWHHNAPGTPSLMSEDPDRGCMVYEVNETLHVLSSDTGALLTTIPIGTQVGGMRFLDGRLIVGGIDGRLLHLDIDSGTIVWEQSTRGRIHANPILVRDSIYIGATDGCFYKISFETGAIEGFFDSIERIVDTALYDPASDRFFISTQAGDLWCLKETRQTGGRAVQ